MHPTVICVLQEGTNDSVIAMTGLLLNFVVVVATCSHSFKH